ncbi:Peptidase, M16 family [hydrothermal vent metagenome]|uniref:Peptidase, M16 family n=1 Tax=hydrothermal vent metagenome TaxID=652676 RepID=A0A3B0S5L9_9ZZZZ
MFKTSLPSACFARALVIVSALFFVLPANAKPLNIDVGEFTLENGMKVVVIPDRRAPVVTHMVWYRVGAADEASGKSGIAHLLEHLLFKGTKKIAPGEFSKIISRNGGQDNAFTSQDYTGYFQRISNDRLEMVMEMEADRMQNLILTEKDIVTERDVVKEERRTRTDNKPTALLSEQMSAALYTAHPYGIPVIGWMSEVAKLNRQDAMDFYRKFYTPSNAILVVAGDVTAEQVIKLAKKHYGVLKNTATPGPRLRTMEPNPIAARRVIMRDKRASSPYIMRQYLAPSYTTSKGNQAMALDVLTEIIGSGTTSRMYKKMVIEDKVAVSTGSWYSGGQMDYGTFGFYGVPAPGNTPEKLEESIDAIIAEVLEKGVTQKELDRARKVLQAETVYLLDSQSSLARVFGRALVSGLTVSDVINWDDNLNSVTLEDIKKAAAGVLQLRRSVTGILLKERTDKPTGTN